MELFKLLLPWELLHTDDLITTSAESMDELLVKLKTWKSEMEKRVRSGEHSGRQKLGQGFFIFHFTDPPDPIF